VNSDSALIAPLAAARRYSNPSAANPRSSFVAHSHRSLLAQPTARVYTSPHPHTHAARPGKQFFISSIEEFRPQKLPIAQIYIEKFATNSIVINTANINSNTLSTGNTSGIFTGDEGFQLNVKGDVNLQGGQITSTDKAIQDGKNIYNVGGTTTTVDLQNNAQYNASASTSTVGIGTERGKTGFGFGNASDQESSVTKAGVSGQAGHQDVRTGDKSAAIAPIFDLGAIKQDIDAQVQITKAFTNSGAQAIGKYNADKIIEADKKEEEAKKAEKAGDKQKAEQLNKEAKEIRETWGEGKPGSLALHTLLGALTGGLGGAAGALSSQAAVNNIANAVANSDLPTPVKEALIQSASALVGAATGGASGAASAVNATANNYLSHNEVTKLSALKDSKLRGQCDTQCDQEIKRLETLDISRNIALNQACTANPTGSECTTLRKDLNAAANSYNNTNALIDPTLRNEHNEITTLSSKYDAAANNPLANGVINSLVGNAIGTVAGPVQLSVMTIRAVAGDAQSQQDLRQLGSILLDTLSDPSGAIVNQLEAADRADAAGNPAEAARIRTNLLTAASGTTAGLTAIGKGLNNLWRSANSLDNSLGTVNVSQSGFISTRQLTVEGMPVKLNQAELAELSKLPNAANSTVKGNLAETAVDSYFQRNGYKALDGKCGAQCFDGVYIKDGKVYVSEVKPMDSAGSIQLSPENAATKLPTQMTPEWIENRAIYLRNNGTPEQIRTAQTILDAIENKSIVRIVTGVNPSGATMVQLPSLKKP
jgi:hypothetical protein